MQTVLCRNRTVSVEEAKAEWPVGDQIEYIDEGSECWTSNLSGGNTVYMMRLNDNTGAICFGGYSEWGRWDNNILETADGYFYTDAGEEIVIE